MEGSDWLKKIIEFIPRFRSEYFYKNNIQGEGQADLNLNHIYIKNLLNTPRCYFIANFSNTLI